MLLLVGHTAAVTALAFAPDGRFLASGSKGGEVFRWDGDEPTMLGDAKRGAVNAVDVRPGGGTVVSGTETGWTRHRESSGTVTYGEVVRSESWDSLQAVTVRGVDRVVGVTGVKFLSPTTLVIGKGHRAKPDPGRLELWDLTSDQPRKPTFTAPHGVRSVAVHPPSNRVAWAEWDRRVFVWDPAKSDPVRFNLPHTAAGVAFHPEGQFLAVTQEWGVRVFDLDRRQERYHATGHKGQVSAVAFSPDGRTLATGSWDGTVRYWDPTSGRETACYSWPTGKVFALAYAPDGLRLAAAGANGAIAVWDLD